MIAYTHGRESVNIVEKGLHKKEIVKLAHFAVEKKEKNNSLREASICCFYLETPSHIDHRVIGL